MKSPITTILVLIAVTLFAGCSAQVNENNKKETDMGTHHVVVKPDSTNTSSSSSFVGDVETYHFTCGEVSVTIQNEELIVNNARYGQLKTGEDILVDNDKVFIDRQERQGIPLSDQEILASAPIRHSTEELAGYPVTVRPGSTLTSTTQVSDMHTFTVGKTNVSIRKDELFVNEISYGQLKAGDTILVENKKVSVSGNVRGEKK